MMNQVTSAVAFLLVLGLWGSASGYPSSQYGPPPAPSYKPQPVYKEEPKPYNFEYGISDQYQGLNFGQSETSDGKLVQGSYSVDLPDGRKQTVTYKADHYNGFIADVNYYGEPQYPKHDPSYVPITFKPQQSYQPAPYQPAPVYH
ncbi:larval cuticle protein A2B-like [Oratosquilla oratoria]|uniref:larval cuticle protein A2B-like n=1 Tax=Oratosquilla oratoria TaxID=337810 RepID=UPI003F75E8E6